MPYIIFYLLKFSISLSVLYLFYQLVLRKLTFYNWNRWFLLGYSLLSFFIPFINISSIAENKNLDAIPILNYLPVVENNTTIVFSKTTIAQVHQPFNYWNLLLIIIAAGIFIMMIRFVIQFFSLLKIKRNAAAIANDDIRIYEVDKSIVPFSFGNAIFINPKLHTEKEFEEIILHEYVHVKQKHTVDILWSEFICIINWFNPFAWLMRHSIRQNLEFIADDNVLQKGFDKKNYQHHLLKVIAQPEYRIANSFNISSLKKRIIMMNKLKSAKAHAIKFLFVLPLIAVLLVAFRDKYKGSLKNDKQQITHAAEIQSEKLPEPIKQTENNILVAAMISRVKKHKAVLDTIPKSNWAEKALYIIDGKKVDSSALGKLNPNNIDSISIFKNNSKDNPYGNKNVIVIKTKNHIDKKDSASENAALRFDRKDTTMPDVNAMLHHPNFTINGLDENAINQPIFFVDGKEVSNSEMKKLDPNSIESITVLKDSSATKVYGEKAKNGVILMKIRKPEIEKNKSHASESNGFSSTVNNDVARKINQPHFYFNNDTIVGTADTIMFNKTGLRIVNGSFTSTQHNAEMKTGRGSIEFNANENSPMIIYNGKEIAAEIKSFRTTHGYYKIFSLNKEQAEDKYGDKGKNGAIEISSLGK